MANSAAYVGGGLIVYGLVIVLGVFGWCANVYKLAHDDFAEPYKSEVFRAVGLVVAPVGAVLGFVTFDCEEAKDGK